MTVTGVNDPGDLYSFLTMGIVILVVLWLVVFVVRKLIGIALIAALVVGAWFLWNDPSILGVAVETVREEVDQWRQEEARPYDNPRW